MEKRVDSKRCVQSVHTFVRFCSHAFPPFRKFTAHNVHTLMASIAKLTSGSWRVQVRRKGQYASRTFRLRSDAQAWAREMEHRVDLGQSLNFRCGPRARTVGDLISLHGADMCEVGRAPLRSKAYSLEKLNRVLDPIRVRNLDRMTVVDFGRRRAQEGAGPVTIGMEVGYLRLVFLHAASVHGVPVSTEPIEHARIALKRLGLIGKAQERDRRPTQAELDRILVHLDSNPRQKIPAGRIIRFAVATGMRQDEISRLKWEDVDLSRRVAIIRDRKHPRDKTGNDQTVALVADAGWAPLLFMLEQAELTGHHGRSVGAAFRRACRELGIVNLRFHDLRHETASRLFEAGYQIPEVALVTGHRDWKMLRRYTNLQPHVLAQRRHLAGSNPAPGLPARSPPSTQATLTDAAVGRSGVGAPRPPLETMRFCTPEPHPQKSWHAANDG